MCFICQRHTYKNNRSFEKKSVAIGPLLYFFSLAWPKQFLQSVYPRLMGSWSNAWLASWSDVAIEGAVLENWWRVIIRCLDFRRVPTVSTTTAPGCIRLLPRSQPEISCQVKLYTQPAKSQPLVQQSNIELRIKHAWEVNSALAETHRWYPLMTSTLGQHDFAKDPRLIHTLRLIFYKNSSILWSKKS